MNHQIIIITGLSVYHRLNQSTAKNKQVGFFLLAAYSVWRPVRETLRSSSSGRRE